MRKVLAVLTILAVPTLIHAEAPKPTAKPKKKDPLAGTVALAPIKEGPVTLIPLAQAAPGKGKVENLVVLDEAMARKLVRIHEVDDGGSVNELTLTNNAKEPLFLLAGEVIIGGKQDRIIGRNTIIPARTTQAVPVFCVEHGRWDAQGKKGEFVSANSLAHGRLRAKASFDDQGEVWNEVAQKNRALKTENATDTYRKIVTEKASDVAASEKRIRAALDKLGKDRARVIGYAVAINGEVATVDLFGSPELLRKLEPKLVRSYLTDAIEVRAKRDAKVPGVADVKTFMFDADSAEAKNAYDTRAGATYNSIGAKAAKASVRSKAADAAATPAAPAPAVYENYSAH